MSFSTEKRVLDMPNLIEVQKNSYQWFLDEGLREVFKDISPIVDYTGNLSLELVDYQLCKEDIKYSIEECKERDATYAAPIKVNVHLRNEESMMDCQQAKFRLLYDISSTLQEASIRVQVQEKARRTECNSTLFLK